MLIFSATISNDTSSENDLNVAQIFRSQRPATSLNDVETKELIANDRLSGQNTYRHNVDQVSFPKLGNNSNQLTLTEKMLKNAASEKCFQEQPTSIAPVTMLNNVILDAAKTVHSNRDRGESLDLKPDFTRVLCSPESLTSDPGKPRKFAVGTKRSIDVTSIGYESVKKLEITRNFSSFEYSLLVFREEYANAYWMVLDCFDIFHILNDLKIDQCQIIWLDAHPPSSMDQLWSILFGDPFQIEKSKTEKRGEKGALIFSSRALLRYPRESSLILKKNAKLLKQFDSFRSHAYKKLSIVPKKLECSQIRLTIAWRRDYVNHPGNPKGLIMRKISNEAEVLTSLKSFASLQITEVQLEKLTVAQQISLMSETDVFFAMHGAGHTMTAFMPSGGAVVEIMTPKKANNFHMHDIATNAGHFHFAPVVPNKAESSDGSSHYIEPETVKKVINQVISKLCPNAN